MRWEQLATALGIAVALGMAFIACSDDNTDSDKSVDKARYEADLKLIAKPRAPGSAQWQAVQDLCKERFEQLGYTVELHKYETGVNVIGKLTGQTKPDEQVIISAHHDHFDDCDGADDNATGVAGVFEAARVLAQTKHDRTLVVACWDEEEVSPPIAVGSRAYANRAKQNGEAIVVAYVFEMLGYTSSEPNSQTIPEGFDFLFAVEVEQIKANQSKGDFILLVHDEHESDASQQATTQLETAAATLGLPTVTLRVLAMLKNEAQLRDLRRSDHAAFWAVDYPALMITDTANFRNPNYHCPEGNTDTLDTLDLDFAIKVVKATVASATEMLKAK